MSSLKQLFIIVIIGLFFLPFYAKAQIKADKENIRNSVNNEKIILQTQNGENVQPVLSIEPREIDVGKISPGEVVTGVFVFKNMGSGVLNWYTSGPEGWKQSENQQLSVTQEGDAESLHFEIRLPVNGNQANDIKYNSSLHNAEMHLEAGRQKLIFKRDLQEGRHKEAIKITSTGGSRTIYITYKIPATHENPIINFNPVSLDMGSVVSGQNISKKLIITNKGKETLEWAVITIKPNRVEKTSVFKKERYVSFRNDEIRGSVDYIVPGQIKDTVEILGKWIENDGYPYSEGAGSSIKYSFNGTGISLILATQSEEGSLTLYLDDNMLNSRDWPKDKKENTELLIAERLVDGPHVLTIVNKEGCLKIEGVKISGKDVICGPSGWMTVLPNSGTITTQTNYLTVTLKTAQLAPGFYGDSIVFKTNAGDAIVDVYAEVVQDNISRIIDIYRYSNGLDYIFTAEPQVEAKRLSINSYVKEGIAFRLFVAETPGTKSFYRWYNPHKKDHFYHHDSKGGGKNLQGYILEGTIGNIATSKMTKTRELYRWINTSTGNHFYSTENFAKRGYRFDGIAGYVR